MIKEESSKGIMQSSKYILVKKPIRNTRRNNVRLTFDLEFVSGVRSFNNSVYVEIDRKYEQYLESEVLDPFVILLLPYAMFHKYDVVSELPCTDELKYKVETVLMPILSKEDSALSSINIYSETTSKKYNGKFVATGATGGVDSTTSVKMHLNSKYGAYNLTHLVFFEFVDKLIPTYHRWSIQEKMENEYNLPLVNVKSNAISVIPMDSTHSVFPYLFFELLMIRSMFKTYYLSSTYYYNQLSLKDFSTTDSPDRGEILFSNILSTEGFEVMCDGIVFRDRFEKIKQFGESVPRYLNVCWRNTYPNCGWCGKCIRTLLCADAAGYLDYYKEVFDIEDYKNNKDAIYSYLGQNKSNIYLKSTYDVLKKEIDDMKTDGRYISSINTIDELIDYSSKSKNSPGATYALAMRYERLSEYDKAFSTMLIAEKYGSRNNNLMESIAQCYRTGKGTNRNQKKALEYYEKSIDKYVNRQINQYYEMLWDVNTPDSLKKMKEITIQDVEKGYPDAFELLGKMYHHGKGVEKNLILAR